MFKNYLIDEISKNSKYIQDIDIAKFIIQAYTGPFHMTKTSPDAKVYQKNIKLMFINNFKTNREKDIFQQLSDESMRIHIVPFIKKHRSSQLLTNMFIKNFEHIDKITIEKLPVDDIRKDLIDIGIIENDKIISYIERFNNETFVPTHSEVYKSNLHPAYIIVLNEVIKSYIAVL